MPLSCILLGGIGNQLFQVSAVLCYAKKNLHMKKGDRLGFIRFGSRTDVIVPKSVTLHVELGQKVKGTETIIGTFK